VLKNFFRRKPRPLEKLLTVGDPQRPYLSGLLIRFDEGYSDAVSFFSAINPNFIPPPLPKAASEVRTASFAAYGLAISIAFGAMRSNGKLLIDGREKSIVEGAMGLSFAMFIFILLSGYLKADGIEIESEPVIAGFAEQFVYLDAAKREAVATKGLKMFQDMISSTYEKVKEWHDTLSSAVQLWLISATPDKRTQGHDEDLRKVFAGQLEALCRAIQ
jgi:hypothetical protein